MTGFAGPIPENQETSVRYPLPREEGM